MNTYFNHDTEFLDYNEMTDEQRRAIIRDACFVATCTQEWLDNYTIGWQSLSDVIRPPVPKVKEYTVQVRPAVRGDQGITMSGDAYAISAFGATRAVIVGERDV